MTLDKALAEVQKLNSSNTTDWQYVAYLFSLAGGRGLHIVVIPLPDGEYSLETTAGIYTTRQHDTKDELLQRPFAKHLEWAIWKWLPNEERRIFKPAEETMICESRTN